MISVTPELYLETLARLCEAIGASEYFSGSVVFTAGGAECRLTTSVIVYHCRTAAPDGVSYPVSGLVPVWWEFHTCEEGQEQLNDFSFKEMNTYLH